MNIGIYWRSWIIPVAFFALIVSWGSTLHGFWGDEAETALYARSILTHGIPYGWDGVNIMGHTDAVSLNEDLINYSNPWAQYYVAAVSFLVFGESPFAARLPFVLFAIASMPILFAVAMELGKDKKIATLAVWLAVLSVQFILFSTQARYYSLMVFFGLAFTYGALRLTSSIWAKILFVVSGICAVYSQYVSFSLWYGALFVVLMTVKRSDKHIIGWCVWYIGLGAGIALAFAPWILSFRPFEHRGIFLTVPTMLDFVRLFWLQIIWAFGPLSRGNILPIGIVPLLLVVWWRTRILAKGKALLFMLLVPSVYLFLTALLTVMYVADNPFTALRYNVIVMPFFLMAIAAGLTHIVEWNKTAGYVLLALFVCTNIFAIQPIRSFWAEYVYELTHPYKTNTDMVASYLLAYAKPRDTAFLNMDRDHEPLVFLLGDSVRFVNRIGPNNPRLFPKNRATLPKYLYLYLEEPDWVILMSKHRTNTSFATFDRRDLFPGVNLKDHYDEIVLPVYFSDTTRPEIDARSFKKINPSFFEQVFVYRKKAVDP